MSVQPYVGQKIRRLRLGLGLSQNELAERANIAAGTVSMVETGRMDVDDVTLSFLATVLDCSITYLEEDDAELSFGTPQLRAYADASQKTVDRTIADSVTAIGAIRRLNLSLLPDQIPLFEGDVNDEPELERFAGEVRTAAGLGSMDVVGNVIRAAERLGCVVLPMDSELGRHLGLSLRIDGVPVIRVSRSSENPDLAVPGDRQRFTVAHELGHLVLHHDAPQPTSPVEATKVEKQAHLFAAAFLVPGDAALQDLASVGGRVTLSALVKLKEKWGYSVKAFVVRFRQLGVIDDDHARSLYKQISARRWNKEEPVPVGTETAIWMGKATKRAAREEGPRFLAHASGLNSTYFTRWSDWQPATFTTGPMAPVSMLTPRPTSSDESSSSQLARVSPLPFRKS